jgi:pyridoxamine 5'-phosphate oxidase family protein
MPLDEAEQRYLAGQARGRLATLGSNGEPQNKPVGFTYNAELGTIDVAGFRMETSAKYRNVAVHPTVAFVVDDAIGKGASGMRFLEIRGRAEGVVLASAAADGLSSHIIRIHPHRVVSWNVDPAHPGMHTRDVTPHAHP